MSAISLLDPARAKLFESAPIYYPPALPRDRRTLAFHEAGHAVLCAVFELPMTGVSVSSECGDEDVYGGKVDFDQEQIKRSAERTADVTIPRPILELTALNLATMYCAGLMAELLLHGIRPTGLVCDFSSDTDNAYKLLQMAFDSDLPLFACQQEAIRFLESNWRWVSAVAEAIEINGHIDSEKVKDLILEEVRDAH